MKMTYHEARQYLTNLELTNEERYKHLQSLIDRLEEEAQFFEDYNTKEEESPLADYVSSFGYGGELAHEIEDRLRYGDEFSDRVKAWVKTQLKELRRGSRGRSELESWCSLQTAGTHYVDGEICGATVGECQDQISEELKQELAKLSEEELAVVSELGNLYHGEYVLTNGYYDRWIMRLDYDGLDAWLGLLERCKQDGLAHGRDLVDYNPPEDGETEDEYREKLSQADEGYRQYSPFEFFCKELIDSHDPEQAWQEYEDAVSEGIDARMAELEIKFKEEE